MGKETECMWRGSVMEPGEKGTLLKRDEEAVHMGGVMVRFCSDLVRYFVSLVFIRVDGYTNSFQYTSYIIRSN